MDKQQHISPVAYKIIKEIAKPLQADQPSAQIIENIQASLDQREYHISFDEEKQTLQSPNRSQDLRAYDKPRVLTIHNRTGSAGHNFSLNLVNKGIYEDGKMVYGQQANAALESQGNTLLIKHTSFTEKFINTQKGIFIISSASTHTKQLQVWLSAEGLKVD